MFTPAPCVFLASGVFPFQFGFLIDMRGSHLGVGFLVFSLVGSFPHCVVGRWLFPACGSFCSSMCIADAGVRFFLWVVYASLGLLAPRTGCDARFLFSQASFVSFSFQIPCLRCAGWGGACGGFLSPRGSLSLLVSVSWVSMALGVLDLLILVFKFLEFWSFVPYTARLLLSLGPSLSVVDASLRPRLPGGLLCALPGVCCFVGLFLFRVLRVPIPSLTWGPFDTRLVFPWISVVAVCLSGAFMCLVDWHCLLSLGSSSRSP